MKKVFLVMLEDGTCAFSRVPGNAEGMRRSSNFKKRMKESNNDPFNKSPLPDSTPEAGPPQA